MPKRQLQFRKPYVKNLKRDDGSVKNMHMAKVNSGIGASNNFHDIEMYIKRFGLEKVTTADILVEAKRIGVIDDYKGNKIWDAMRIKKGALPTATFTNYLNRLYK